MAVLRDEERRSYGAEGTRRAKVSGSFRFRMQPSSVVKCSQISF